MIGHPALAWAREQARIAAGAADDALTAEQREAFIEQLASAILESLDARKRLEREITLDALARDSGAQRAGG